MFTNINLALAQSVPIWPDVGGFSDPDHPVLSWKVLSGVCVLLIIFFILIRKSKSDKK